MIGPALDNDATHAFLFESADGALLAVTLDRSVTHLQLKSPATLACNTGALGTMRFNPTTGAPQICVQR